MHLITPEEPLEMIITQDTCDKRTFKVRYVQLAGMVSVEGCDSKHWVLIDSDDTQRRHSMSLSRMMYIWCVFRRVSYIMMCRQPCDWGQLRC
jgi:hypothetical protein